MAGDDPVREPAPVEPGEPAPAGDPELCGQCGLQPTANGTYWCSATCMELWTSAHTAGQSVWPTPGFTETRHAGTKTVARDTWTWLDTNLPMGPLPHRN